MKKIFIFSIFALAALFVFASGIAFAQNQQVQLPFAGLTPESPFYFLDRLGENLQQFFTFNPEAKAKLQIEFAAERIAEIKVMIEKKGVSAKGLAIAESLLQANVAYAAEIVNKEKTSGKNVAALAKTLNDEFDARDKLLEQIFKDAKAQLKAQRKEIETNLLAEARRVGDTAQIAILEGRLNDINQQIDALGQKKDQLKNSLQNEQKKIEKEMSEDDQKKEEQEQKEEQEEVEAEEAEETAEPEEVKELKEATTPFKETTYNLGMPSELGKVIDVNNDGLLDVVVLGEKREKGKAPEGFVNIFYQNNEGKLILSENTYSIEHGADMINAGDVNNDGLIDIVITTDDVSASVTAFLIQQPLNTFTLSFEPAPDLPTSAGSPDIGDMNGDSLNDVVRGNKPRGSISIYNQNVDHTLQDPVEIFVGGNVQRWRTSDGRIGDYNNDGKNDFAVRNGVLSNGNAFFTVYYNSGNDQFNIVNYDTGVTSNMGLSDIRSADMDNNSLNDVVISINEGNIGVYLQANGGLKGTIYSSGLHSIRGIALGDIDGDGKKDIVASSFDCSDGVSILIQNNDGSYRTPIKLSSQKGFGGMVEVGDVNNDGKNEIVTTNGLTLQTSNCPKTSISVIEVNRGIDTRCKLKPEAGPCKALFTRYYFDQQERICKGFTWGGCQGVVPFETLGQCKSVCE